MLAIDIVAASGAAWRSEAARPALASGAMKVVASRREPSWSCPTAPPAPIWRRRSGPAWRRRRWRCGSTARSRDLSAPLPDGERVEIVTDRSPEALDLIRHDAAHVMATAVMELYPGTKISIGPPIENGFYYDFEFPEGVKVTDAGPRADRGAHARARRGRRAVRAHRRVGRGGRAALRRRGPGLQGRADPRPASRATASRPCRCTGTGRSPTSAGARTRPSTGRIKAFKLLSLAGAYWRGDERNKMLTRIYGTAFFSKKDLERHLEMLEQARARDHRRLGPQLGLFLLRPESPGMPFYLPNGMVVVNEIQRVVREQLGQARLRTRSARRTSSTWSCGSAPGHWDNYRENMFFTRTRASSRASSRSSR